MNIPENLAKAAAARTAASYQKIEQAKESIEADVRKGILAPSKVGLTFFTKRAEIGERFFAGERRRLDRDAIQKWIAGLSSIQADIEPSFKDKYFSLKSDYEILEETNRKLSDRIHSFAQRLRESNKMVRDLRENAKKTVVHIKR